VIRRVISFEISAEKNPVFVRVKSSILVAFGLC